MATPNLSRALDLFGGNINYFIGGGQYDKVTKERKKEEEEKKEKKKGGGGLQ